MNKAWSLLWLVFVSSIAFSITLALLKPYIGLIAITLVIVILTVIGVGVYRQFKSGRRRF